METSQLAIEPVQAPAEMSLKPQAAAMEAIEDVTYGSIAGIVGKYIEYPFDTVKVRLQSQPDHLPLRYTGPLDCFRQSLKADGIGGLYRGITAPLVGAAAENSCLFMFESVGREAMFSIGWASRRDGLSLPQLYLTGAFAGAFASLALTPIELVKCKIQAPAGGASSGQQAALRPVAVIRSIFRHGGIMGFWHGQMGTLIRETGGSAAWFGAKETTTALFREQRLKSVMSQAEREALATTPLPFWQQAIAGASAGIAYNFLFFPADTIKSRMQTMPLGGSHVKRTFWSEGVAVWKQHGLKGMYRGCGITCLRSAPSSAFIFMVYDGLKRHLPMH